MKKVEFETAAIYFRIKKAGYREHRFPNIPRAKIAIDAHNKNRGVIVKSGLPIGKVKGKWIYSIK